MAIFNNMSITNAGQELFAKAQAGQEINFTKMQVGAGQIGTQNPATLNALVNGKFDIPIQSITPNSALRTATISGSINNNNITEAVYICEIGLFATDPDKGEILYGYASAGTYGDYYAPSSAGPYTWNYEINAAIGNAANITAQLSGLNYDYGVINTNTTFNVISGGNQKEINKSIDEVLSKINAQQSEMIFQTAGGTGTEITLNIKGTLVNGYPITFIASANNGGAATKINSKNVYKPGTTTPPNFIAGKAYTVWYNQSGDCFFIKASAEGNAVSENVLADKTFSNDNDTGLIGTMPNNTGVGKELSINETWVIPKGYFDGTTKVTQNIPNRGEYQYSGGVGSGDDYLAFNNIPYGYYPSSNNGWSPEIRAKKSDVANHIGLTADKIVSGNNICGVVGSYDPLTLVVGDSVIFQDTTVYTTSSTSLTTIISTICVNKGGTIRIKYDAKTGSTSITHNISQIYINGVAVGTQRDTTGARYITYTEDFTVSAGDIITLRCYKSGSGSYSINLTNFKICCANTSGWFINNL